MASKQETGIGRQAAEYSHAHFRAEKELNVEPFCAITIERTLPDGSREVLHRYDMPRSTMWDWQWVYEWRKARYTCKYPKDHVSLYYSFYDKGTDLTYNVDSLRSKQVAAKALITRYNMALEEYVRQESAKLFFDPDSDPLVKKTKAKIAAATQRFESLTKELEKLIADNKS